MKIEKAVIPAAGLGTRMLPLTESTPKEMLPVMGRPMIEFAVREAVDAGIGEICIVIRRGKEAIRDYLTSRGEREGRGSLPPMAAGPDYRLDFVFQEKPLGLGDALYSAGGFVGESPFLMIIPDQMLFSSVPASQRLVENYDFQEAAVLSSMVKIPSSEAEYFPGARGFIFEKVDGRETFPIDSLMEEDEVQRTLGKGRLQLRGFGRTVYPPQIFEYLTEEYINPATGEVDLLKTFEALKGRIAHYGLLLEGLPCDFGTLKGYRYYNEKLASLKTGGPR